MRRSCPLALQTSGLCERLFPRNPGERSSNPQPGILNPFLQPRQVVLDDTGSVVASLPDSSASAFGASLAA